MTVDEYFHGQPESRHIFDAVMASLDSLGVVQVVVTKSQVAFRSKKDFAWVWMPGMYLHGKYAPLVLSIGLHRRDGSSRWKQIVEPRPGRFMHHLELYSTTDVDDEVHIWLREAWVDASA